MNEGNDQTLPIGWKLCKLPEIAQLNPPLDRCIVADDVSVDFVPMRAVEEEGGGVLRPEVSMYGKVMKGYTAFLPGDVIMAKITPCMENGKTCVVPQLPNGVCFGSTEFHVIRAEEGVEPRWISYFLLQHSTRNAAQRRMMGGVGQMRVPAAFLEDLRLPMPPHAEKLRIIEKLDEVLSGLDEGVKALEGVRAKLGHYRAAVLKAAVEGRLTAEWRKVHSDVEPASEFLERILAERRRRWEDLQLKKYESAGKEPPKNWMVKYREPVAPNATNIETLPRGWCWATIEQLTTELSNGFGKRKQDQGASHVVLRLADIVNGRMSLAATREVKCLPDEVKRYGLAPLDVLFIRVNGSADLVGRAILVDEIEEVILYCDHFIRGRMVFPTMAKWMRVYGDTERFRRFVDQNKVSSAGQNTISQTSLESFVVALPPVEERDAIVDVLEDQFSVIDHLDADIEAKLNSVQVLRQSILRAAFEGKLVPQHPREEPASELVKRIAAERAERDRYAKEAKSSAKPRKAKREMRGHSGSALSAG